MRNYLLHKEKVDKWMKHLAELEEFERELEREFPISDSVIFENIDDPKIIDIKKDKKDKK